MLRLILELAKCKKKGGTTLCVVPPFLFVIKEPQPTSIR